MFPFLLLLFALSQHFRRDTYINHGLISSENAYDNISLINFILPDSSFKTDPLSTSHLEFFKIPKQLGYCLKSHTLAIANDTSDELYIRINQYLSKAISHDTFYTYFIPYDRDFNANSL